MADKLQTLRQRWEACAINWRVASERLKKAESAYVRAHLLAKPAQPPPDTAKKPRDRQPAHDNPYSGA